ncbi:MAG: MFS transporter [Peptoniphilus sp.]|nr:MFS transporter [Peptoniphilus sp.]
MMKIQGKIKNRACNVFGKRKPADNLIVLIISFLIATMYFYYISDRGYNKFLVLALLTLVHFVVLSVVVYLLKHGVEIIQRIRAKNIIFFVALYYIFYKIFAYLEDESFMSEFEIHMASLACVFVILLFAKSLMAVLKNKKKFALIFLIPTTLALGFAVHFLLSDGESVELTDLNIDNSSKISLDTKIKYSADYMDYESGEDEGISLLRYVNYSGRTKKIRDRYFGTSLRNVPLRGRVWYPVGEKRCPVVFMIHGNHRFTTENYLGYEYLGKYLARRGIAFVTVDENMLNGFSKFGLRKENDARAVLLLENINYLFDKNRDANSQYHNLFDETKVALAGHSRGGEAVAIANEFNNLNYNPDSGKGRKYKFDIKAVASIAPTVDQYNPSGKDIKLKGVNFLTLHGTHDRDVTGFSGMKLYDNTLLDRGANNFKSAIYVAFANHGQFNELWGMDAEPPYDLFIDKSALIEEESQRELTSKILYAFFKESFEEKGDREIFKNLQDYDLPDTIYYSRYEDSTFESICDFEEDYDMSRFPYGRINFDEFRSIREEEVSIGGKYTENTGLYLGYREGSHYELVMEERLPIRDYLQFDVLIDDRTGNFEDLNLNITMYDDYGHKATVKVGDFVNFYGKVKVEYLKLQKYTEEYDYKSSFQVVRIPMEEFKNENIDLNKIKYIDFDFEEGYGNIILDNIGYSN